MLKIRFKNNKNNTVWLVEPKVTIGRLATNDLVVDDPDVADTHLEILVEHENLTLKNLVPNQPVKLNKESITKLCTLKSNDVITVGSTELEVIDPKLEGRPQEPKVNRSIMSGWALKANHTALGNRVYQLSETTVIGRSSECDIVLSAAHLSRRHVRLQVIDGLLFVKDLGSANGTFLNGKQVVEARLKRGDELRLDTLSFGVIGPADDLTKTTVRPRSQMRSTPETTPAPRVSPPVTSIKPALKKPVQVTNKKLQPDLVEPHAHYGKYSMAVLVILVIIVVAALYLKG
jgi:pSer/pThr/pTyr-binding forkhead associated (FHA) protein